MCQTIWWLLLLFVEHGLLWGVVPSVRRLLRGQRVRNEWKLCLKQQKKKRKTFILSSVVSVVLSTTIELPLYAHTHWHRHRHSLPAWIHKFCFSLSVSADRLRCLCQDLGIRITFKWSHDTDSDNGSGSVLTKCLDTKIECLDFDLNTVLWARNRSNRKRNTMYMNDNDDDDDDGGGNCIRCGALCIASRSCRVTE